MTGVLDWSHAPRGGAGSGGGWYHCRVKMIGRTQGRSVVAAAAYRTGLSLRDDELEQTFDFTRRRGVETTFTVAPDHAPDWVTNDLERLWNSATEKDTRVNSQLGREVELALPASLGPAERRAIAVEFSQALVGRYGVAVTGAIHDPSRDGDDRNYHLHALMTTREITAEGFGKKTRVLDDIKTGPQEVAYIRELAAGVINRALERAGSAERVDARSFEARGIDREPTEHLGPSATEMERQGRGSERGDRNREIGERNETIDRLVDELADIEAQIVAEEERQLDDRYGPSGEGEESQEQTPEGPASDANPTNTEPPRRLSDEEKRAARSAVGPGAANTGEFGPRLPDEEKREARDAIRDAEEVDRRLGSGGVRHFGLSMPLWQHVAVFIEQIAEQAGEIVKGAWQRFLDWREGRGDNDRGNDSGPDLTR